MNENEYTASDFHGGGAEASSLGLPPGQIPQRLVVSGIPFELMYADAEKFEYVAKVTIFND